MGTTFGASAPVPACGSAVSTPFLVSSVIGFPLLATCPAHFLVGPWVPGYGLGWAAPPGGHGTNRRRGIRIAAVGASTTGQNPCRVRIWLGSAFARRRPGLRWRALVARRRLGIRGVQQAKHVIREGAHLLP